ncbi:unnamed protein product, partial [Prorocentrum cordatum]
KDGKWSALTPEDKEDVKRKSVVENTEEALKTLQGKFDEMASLMKWKYGNPKHQLEKFRKELTELLTKPGFNISDYEVIVKAYSLNMNENTPIMKERKILVNEWCRINLFGQSDNNFWVYEEEKKDEDKEDKPEDADKPPETNSPSEEKTEETPPGVQAKEEPEVKAIRLLEANPGSSHLRIRANVGVFCEEMSSLQVSTGTVLEAKTLLNELTALKDEHQVLIPNTKSMNEAVADLIREATPQVDASKVTADGEQGLDSEMCQEQEQEQEQVVDKGPGDEPDDRTFTDFGDTVQWQVSDLLKDAGRKKLFKDAGTFHSMKDFVPQGGQIDGHIVKALKFDVNVYLSSNYAEKKLKQEATDGAHKRRLPNAVLLLYVKNGKDGCWAILNMAEAETLRMWMLNTSSRGGSPAGSMGIVTTRGEWLTKPVDDKELIIKPEVRDPLREGKAPLRAAAPLVFSRFFNWEVYYDEQELVTLVTVLKPIPDEEERKLWLQAVRQARRRDRKEIKQTVLEQAVKIEDPRKLESVRQGMKALRKYLEKYPDTDAAFKDLDVNGDHFIDRKEFKKAFADSTLDKTQLNRLFDHFDASKDKQLDLREFLQALSLKELSVKDRVKQMLGDQSEGQSSGMKKATGFERDDGDGTWCRTSIKLLGHKVIATRARRGLGALISTSREDLNPGELQVVCGASAYFIGGCVISCAVGGVATVAPSGITVRQKDRVAVFFEVTVMEAPPGSTCSVGIATAQFAQSENVQRVGEDAHSWGVGGLGRTPAKLHDRHSDSFGSPAWSPGTVVGVLVDLQNEQKAALRFFLNGEELQKAEFSNIPLAGDGVVVPVFTVEYGAKLYVNWGNEKLRYRPPSLDSSVLTVSQLANLDIDGKVRKRDLKEGSDKLGKMLLGADLNNQGFIKNYVKWVVQEESEGLYSVRLDTKFAWMGCAPEPIYLHGMLLTTGRWYYEVEISETPGNFFKLTAGYADARCDGKPKDQYGHFGVGEVPGSWGMDVADTELAGDGKPACFLHMEGNDYEAKQGDIYGFEADIDNATIAIHYRGIAEVPPKVGLAFVKVPFQGGLRPIIGFGRGN